MTNPGPVNALREVTSQTSTTLLRLVVLKDEAAWRDLTRLYGDLIRFWCRRAKVPDADIDDIEQDVFRAVFSAIPTFVPSKAQGSFRSWLWTITRNKVRDYFKIRLNHAVSVGGTDAYLALQQLPECELREAESDALDEADPTRQALKMIQGEVKPHTFDAFWRSTVDGIAPDMIAKDLGITVDSVYQAKARVLRRLRQLLD